MKQKFDYKVFSSILQDQDYQKLKLIPRHGTTNTYDHSLRVAHAAASLAALFRCDAYQCVRAALLHDFCLIDHRQPDKPKGCYLFYHPREAAHNAARFHITAAEDNAIRCHMFPLAGIPRSRVAVAVSVADKYVAAIEAIKFIPNYVPKLV